MGVLLAATTCLGTADVTAQTNPDFDLEWESPSSCPQRTDVTDQIRALLGASPSAAMPSGLHARGAIEPINERFQLTLSVRVGQSERSRVISSEDCTSLGKAAAVVLGLLIRRERESEHGLSESDLGSEFDRPPRESATPKPAEPVRPNDPADRIPQTHDATNQRHWNVLLMAPTGAVDLFTMSSFGYGFGLAAGVKHGRWRWFASGTLWQTQTIDRAGNDSYQATFKRKSLELWGCRGWRRDTLELSPCALLGFDFVGVDATSETLTASPKNNVVTSIGAGLMGTWHLGSHLGLYVSATGRVRAHSTEYVVEGMLGTDRTHTTPWATTVTSLGAEWIF